MTQGYKLSIFTVHMKQNSIPEGGCLCRKPQKLVPERAMAGAPLLFHSKVDGFKIKYLKNNK